MWVGINPKMTNSGLNYSVPGTISFTITRPSIVIVDGSAWRGGVVGFGSSYIDMYLDGAFCNSDRGTDSSNSSTYASTTCIRMLPAGTHSITVNSDTPGIYWSYLVLGI